MTVGTRYARGNVRSRRSSWPVAGRVSARLRPGCRHPGRRRRGGALRPSAARRSDRPGEPEGRAGGAHRRGFPGLGRPLEHDREGAVHRPGRLPAGRQHGQLPAQPLRHPRGRHELGPEPAAGQGHPDRPPARIPLDGQEVRPGSLPGRQGLHPLSAKRRLRIRHLLGRRSAHDLPVRSRGLPLHEERPEEPLRGRRRLARGQGAHPGSDDPGRDRLHVRRRRRQGAEGRATAQGHRRRAPGGDAGSAQSERSDRATST